MMQSQLSLKVVSAGSSAVICYLPEPVRDDYPLILHELADTAKRAGAIDVVPAYNSLLVVFDARGTTAAEIVQCLERALPAAEQLAHGGDEQTIIRIPVCYEGKYALDLQELAEQSGLTPNEVIAKHTAVTYSVACLGFIPGFAFLGYVDDAIATPRRDNPRPRVAAGSVGIAGTQTGVYPSDSPGGWNIIGRTPEKLYDPQNGLISRFEIGDSVQFYAISEKEFKTWG